MDTLLLPVLVFGAVTMLGLVGLMALNSKEDLIKVRLNALDRGVSGDGAVDSRKVSVKDGGSKSSFFEGFAKRLGESVKSIFDGGGDETDHRLAMAGFNPQTYLGTFHGARVMVGLGLATVGVFVMLLVRAPAGKMILAGTVGILAGMLLPNIWLSININKRKERISASLPNMVDLLVVCVEAGLGLDAAMTRVGIELERSAPDLSRELNQLGRELTGGQSHEQALSRLAWRIGIEDIENLVSMLIQAERFGTSIAVSLRVFSDSFRTARRQRVEEAAAKTTVKLLFPLVLFIFPAIFVILLGPPVVNIIWGGALK